MTFRSRSYGNRWPDHLLILSLLVSLAVAVRIDAAEPAKPSFSDNDIFEAIEAEVRSAEAVSADLMDVEVNAGVVTLSGKAFTLFGKRRAVRLVGSLKGVRAIVDRVEVLPAGRSDEQIFADVQAALRDDPVADHQEIAVRVGQGRVTLEGTVDSYAEKRLAETAVAAVRGVTEIENRITILKPEIRSDDEIKPEILRRFELNPYLAGGLIQVDVTRGSVKLSGNVGSLNEKSIAQFLSWVPGVSSVDASQLKVNPAQARERRRDKFSILRNDVQLERAVRDALLYDPRVKGQKIEVRVRQGVVSLLGKVSSLAAKRSAQLDAINTLGVRRVINQLKVQASEWPGDPAVTTRAQEALTRDAYLSGLNLKASSHFGKVYLRGEANTQFEKQRAEDVVANVSGVLDAVNRITVDARWTPKSDEEIREDFQRRLRWSPVLETADVAADVSRGAMTLRGTVNSWHERKAAFRLAYQSGARRVTNNIDVRVEPAAALDSESNAAP